MQRLLLGGLMALEHDLALALHHGAELLERVVGPVVAEGVLQLVAEDHQRADDEVHDQADHGRSPPGGFGPCERRADEEEGDDDEDEDE